MTIGGSLFLIAVGAILYFAVTADVSGIDISTVGLILMAIGIVGLVLGLIMYSSARRRGVVVDPRVDPRDPPAY